MKADTLLRAALWLSLVSLCSGVTWDDSFEFDSTQDYDAVNDQCVSESGTVIATREDSNGSNALVLPDGYLQMIGDDGEDGKNSFQNSSALLSATGGWMIETRLRLSRDTDFRGDGGRAFQLRTRDGDQKAFLFIGNDVGPDVVGTESESAFPGAASWEPDPSPNKTLVERTSDWHVYRMIYDPTLTSGLELWVDGRKLTEAVPALGQSTGVYQIKFGPQKGVSSEVHVDYIRWADGTIERPTLDEFPDTPLLRNRWFDNIYDSDGVATGASAKPVFWAIENITGVGLHASATVNYETSDEWRCELYGKALRLENGKSYDAAVKQIVSTGTDKTVRFTAHFRGYTRLSNGYIEGRVGMDPVGSGCNRNAPLNVWSDWVDLETAPPGECLEFSATGRTEADDICVFIEARAPNDSGAEQDAFIDNAAIEVCGNPPQDLNGDNDVDVSDFAGFQLCFSGATIPYPTTGGLAETCPCMDSNHDGDVDVSDFAAFSLCFSGANSVSPCWVPPIIPP